MEGMNQTWNMGQDWILATAHLDIPREPKALDKISKNVEGLFNLSGFEGFPYSLSIPNSNL